jgi:anti-anti-sigma regulatory factor
LAIHRGEHACCRFPAADDRRRLTAAFAADAVGRGDRFVHLCRGEDVAGAVARLSAIDAAVGRAVERGQMTVRPARGVYLQDGRFDPQHTMATFRDEHARSLREGYAGVTIAGEMSWLHDEPPGHERLPAYERDLARELDEPSLTLLCQYDRGLFAAGAVSGIETLHQVDFAPELASIGRSGSLTAARVVGDETLRLAGELDHQTAPAVVDALHAHFHGPLRLELADLTFVDVAGMRALRGSTGQPLTVVSSSPPVRRLAALLAWDSDPGVSLPV